MRLGVLLSALCMQLEPALSAVKAKRRTLALCENKGLKPDTDLKDEGVIVQILSSLYRKARPEERAKELLAVWEAEKKDAKAEAKAETKEEKKEDAPPTAPVAPKEAKAEKGVASAKADSPPSK
jgi:hypothetical protein